MHTFRFVFFSWICGALMYPPAVLLGDALMTGNALASFWLPLQALTLLAGLPLLLAGWLLLHLLQRTDWPPLVQYALWSAALLALVLALLAAMGCPPLPDGYYEQRLLVPMYITGIVVLLLRYPYFLEFCAVERDRVMGSWQP